MRDETHRHFRVFTGILGLFRRFDPGISGLFRAGPSGLFRAFPGFHAAPAAAHGRNRRTDAIVASAIRSRGW